MDEGANPLRLGFAGTPGFAARILEALLAAGRIPAVVYTQPDRPVGRGRKTQHGPVKEIALARGLPLEQPDSLRGLGAAETLSAYALDVMVVAAYGLILPSNVLHTPRYGCINVHASLLPRWRGAAPVERAIMAGDAETGVCIMQMDEGLDTGPVYECRHYPIASDTNGPGLEQALADLGAEALLYCLDHLAELTPEPQSEGGATYAPKLTRQDAVIHWCRAAPELARQIRALTGRLPAFAACGGVQLRVLAAEAVPGGTADDPPGLITRADRAGIVVACGQGQLRITRLQLSRGKARPLTAAEALNGYADLLGAGRMLHDGIG